MHVCGCHSVPWPQDSESKARCLTSTGASDRFPNSRHVETLPMKKSAKRWLGLGTTAVVLVLVFYHLTRSAEWREFRWSSVWSLLIHARRGFVLAAVGASYASYLMRAYRWKFFLDPIKKASLWVLFVGQIFGFSSIYLIGRPGEFVRPAYIANKENVPFSSMLAIWLLERVYDIGAMVMLFAGALQLVPLRAGTGHGRRILAHAHWWGGMLMVGLVIVLVLLALFRLNAEELTTWLANTFRFLPTRVRKRLGQVFRSFSAGLDVIENFRDLTASLVSTAALWIINISVVWLVFQSLGGRIGELSWIAAGLVLFFAALGLLIQLPGVGGGYQGAAIVALTRIFRVNAQEATGAAILLFAVLLVPCLALGIFLLAYEGLTFKKLGKMTEKERATVEKIKTST